MKPIAQVHVAPNGYVMVGRSEPGAIHVGELFDVNGEIKVSLDAGSKGKVTKRKLELAYVDYIRRQREERLELEQEEAVSFTAPTLPKKFVLIDPTSRRVMDGTTPFWLYDRTTGKREVKRISSQEASNLMREGVPSIHGEWRTHRRRDRDHGRPDRYKRLVFAIGKKILWYYDPYDYQSGKDYGQTMVKRYTSPEPYWIKGHRYRAGLGTFAPTVQGWMNGYLVELTT